MLLVQLYFPLPCTGLVPTVLLDHLLVSLFPPSPPLSVLEDCHGRGHVDITYPPQNSQFTNSSTIILPSSLCWFGLHGPFRPSSSSHVSSLVLQDCHGCGLVSSHLLTATPGCYSRSEELLRTVHSTSCTFFLLHLGA